MTSKPKKKESQGSVQPPPVPGLAPWIERQFRGKERPQSIDGYPLWKGRDRETRCYHYDIKEEEKIGAERAVELACEIYSDCQLHCDNLRNTIKKGEKTYEISVCDERRGGLANPVGTFLLTLSPRVHRPAPTEGEGADEDEEDPTAKSSALQIMLESVKLVHERERAERENEGRIVGDTMLIQKDSLVAREGSYQKMVELNIDLLNKWAGSLEALAQKGVELRAVGIDEKNAEEDREDRRATRKRDNLWADTMQAGMMEAIKVLGQLFPGFGQLALAHMQGKALPEPPTQLEKAGGSAPPTPAQLEATPEEKVIVDRFIDEAEKHRIDDSYTAAEKLFGKDDAEGNPIEKGVFSRSQVAILSGVHKGTVGIEALDALLPDSGRPEAITPAQMVQAMAFMRGTMIKDLTRFVSLRNEARVKRQ